MPSVDISSLKVKTVDAEKFKAMAKSMGVTQIALFGLLVEGGVNKQAAVAALPAPKVSPEEWVISHFNNKLWLIYFKEQPDELNLYSTCDDVGAIADIYSNSYKKATAKLIDYFTSKNKNVTLDTLHSDTLKINKD